MLSRNFLFVFLSIFQVFYSPSSAVLSDIHQSCDDVGCLTEDDYRSPELNYKFLSAGVPQILWDEIRSSKGKLQGISSNCSDALKSILDGMTHGESWSYAFIDSSGKSPPGLLRSTMTAIGDYDECLRIESPLTTGPNDFTGQYCMIDMFPLRIVDSHGSKNLANDSFSLSRTSAFKGFGFAIALCLPSTCSRSDVESLTSRVMTPFKIKVAGAMNCDTKSSISMVTKIFSLTVHQKVSLMFVSFMIGVVLLSTAIHIYNRFIRTTVDFTMFGIQELPRFPQPEVMTSMSILETTRRVFYAKPWTHEVLIFDALKLGIILSGTIGHILVCAEMPISYFMMDRHEVINYLFSSAETQPILNDAGLLGVAFLSGVASFLVMYPMAQKKKLPFIGAIVDRLLRFLPAMISLTALEFLWPLIGSGPLFTRVADFNIFRCTKYWWLNLVFLNNHFIKSIDICGGSSFYSSVDMQMFIIGLIVVYVFCKHGSSKGLLTCYGIAILSTLKTLINAIVYETTGTLFTSDPIHIKISEYFDYIHMSIFSYLPAYMTGFVIGFHILKEKDVKTNCENNGNSKWTVIPKLTHWTHHILWLAAAQGFTSMVTLTTVAYNHFKIIPQSMTFIVILINRTCQLTSFVILFLYLLGLKRFSFIKEDEKEKKSTDSQDSQAPQPEIPQEQLSIFKALCRLSFPLYVSNYLYIRTEFFTRRTLIPSHSFLLLKRIISSMILIYVVAYVFQIFFLGPLEAVRKSLFDTPRSEGKRTSKKDNETKLVKGD